MKFEERKIEDCVGWCLAHSVESNSRKFAKASLVTDAIVNHLKSRGFTTLQVFQLEQGDLDEDQAAEKAANLIKGKGLTIQSAGRGRANVIAAQDGLFLPGNAIDQLNALDDAFSAACKRPYTKVTKGDLLATIKIVPYGVPSSTFDAFEPNQKVNVAAFSPFTATLLVGGSDIQPKTENILASRLSAVGGKLASTLRLRHTVKDYADAIDISSSKLILLLGVSAISDTRDTLPEAVRMTGGTVIKVGLPTDPGNLLMVARKGSQTIIGLPGCARSPALNGFDWVLERFAANLPLDAETLSMLGTGGLLREPADRSFPRRKKAKEADPSSLKVSAILLAAGHSSRSGEAHKLLSLVDDKSVIEHSAAIIAKAGISEIAAVTGDAREDVEKLLANSCATLVYNANHSMGMGTSIAEGVKSLGKECEFALISLGDMPFVQASTIEALIKASKDAFSSAILMPTFNGKRGHPVLWGQRHFSALSNLSGDVGGREIMRKHEDRVIEVPVSDPGILIDLDTPEMLKQFGITPTAR